MAPIFYIKDGNLSFGEKTVLSDIDIYISPGDRICLVGKNGSGKSSLMKLIDGEYELDTGEHYVDPTTHISFLKQEMDQDFDGTVKDFILKHFDDPEANSYKAEIILENLEVDGNLSMTTCSGGQLRRAHLALALALEPEILLLDEPTNHLDIRTIEWLENYINSYRGAVICISHDRTFLENTTNRVWWIDRGTLRKSNKGFRNYDQWREEIIADEEAVLRNMNRKLEAEKGWLNTGVTARRKRNVRRLANLHRLRDQLREHEAHLKGAKAKLMFDLLEEAKKSKFIMQAIGVTYGYEQHKTLIKNLDVKIKKGEKIGLIGANGSGKTTLIKLLTKEIEPNDGVIKHGKNLEITYFDQHRSELNPAHTLQKTLCPGGGDQVFLKSKTMHVAAYLKNFMFDPRQMHDKVATLSGGQANRLLLAKALINPGNLLILDEPTNDLDMESLEILLEILAEYDGTLIIVSHDRDFLERLVTRTIIFAEDQIYDLYGGYNDYLKFYKKELGDKSPSKKSKTANKTEKKTTRPAEEGKKLSYKYQRMLEVLPDEIDGLEQEIVRIENELMDPDMFTGNPQKFQTLTISLSKTRATLELKEDQWLEVMSMNDDIS